MNRNNVNIRSALFHTKPYEMLLFLGGRKESYAKEISRETDVTYSHAVKKLNEFEEAGYVQSVKQGRKRNYELTDKGRRIAAKLREIEVMFNPDLEDYSAGGSLQEIELN